MTLLREIRAIVNILVNTILTMFVLQETLSQIIVLENGFESTQNRNMHILVCYRDLAVYSSNSVSTHIQPHTKDIFHRLNYFPFFFKKPVPLCLCVQCLKWDFSVNSKIDLCQNPYFHVKNLLKQYLMLSFEHH